MADIKKCDRCGKVYDFHEPEFKDSMGFILNLLGLSETKRKAEVAAFALADALDLCSDCKADFHKWWKGGADNA